HLLDCVPELRARLFVLLLELVEQVLLGRLRRRDPEQRDNSDRSNDAHDNPAVQGNGNRAGPTFPCTADRQPSQAASAKFSAPALRNDGISPDYSPQRTQRAQRRPERKVQKEVAATSASGPFAARCFFVSPHNSILIFSLRSLRTLR